MTIPVSGLNLGSLLGLGKPSSAGGPGSFPFEGLQLTVNSGESPVLQLTPELMEQLQALLPEGYLEALANLEQPAEAGNLLPIEVADFAAQSADGPEASFKESFAPLLAFLHYYTQQGSPQTVTTPNTPLVDDSAMNPVMETAKVVPPPTMREWLLKLESALQTSTTRPENGVQLNTNILDDAESLPGVRAWLQRLQHVLQRDPVSVGSSAVGNRLAAGVEMLSGSVADKLPVQPNPIVIKQPIAQTLIEKSPLQPQSMPTEQPFVQLLNKSFLGADKAMPAGQGQGVTTLSSLFTPASQGGTVMSAQAATVSPAPITVAPNEKGWDGLLGNRVMWVVGKQLQSASLKITPPNMGPIEIRVAVQNDQASVSFTAQHGVVREAIETAIPRLREMFNENNLQLVNVDVGQKGSGEQRTLHDFFQQARQDLNQSDELVDGGGDEVPELGDEPVQVSVQVHDGLLDDYA